MKPTTTVEIEGRTQSFPSADAARRHLIDNGWQPQILGDGKRTPSRHHFVMQNPASETPNKVRYAHIIES